MPNAPDSPRFAVAGIRSALRTWQFQVVIRFPSTRLKNTPIIGDIRHPLATVAAIYLRLGYLNRSAKEFSENQPRKNDEEYVDLKLRDKLMLVSKVGADGAADVIPA